MSHETHLDEHFTAGKTARVTPEVMGRRPADRAIVAPTLSVEVHGAEFEWTYLSLGVPRSGRHTVWLRVYDEPGTGEGWAGSAPARRGGPSGRSGTRGRP